MAGFATLVLTGPMLAAMEPGWLAEGITGALTAAVWMAAGLRVARSHHAVVGPVLYGLGAAAAWFLTRGVVHSVSPHYGLFPFTLACLAGAGAWLLVQRRAGVRAEWALAALLPVAFVSLGAYSALADAPPGLTRQVHTTDSARKWLPVVRQDPADWSAWYVWSPAGAGFVPGADSTVFVEYDPGSDGSPFHAAEVTEREGLARACAAFSEQEGVLLEEEIASGDTPRFMRRVPVRYRVCENGRMWLVRRVEASRRGSVVTGGA